MSSSQELALQEPLLLVSWHLMVSTNSYAQMKSRGETPKREHIYMMGYMDQWK